MFRQIRQLVLLGLPVVVVLGVLVVAPVAHAGVVDEIKARGVLLVGVEGKGYGGFMQVKKDGSLDGHDPELSALVAKRLGVKLQLVDTAWAGIVPALYAKRFDMILGGMTITKARMERALLIDPGNFNMRYNFACAISVYLKDMEAALDMLGPVFETISDTFLPYAKVDPDLELLRDDPRYLALLAATEARLAAQAGEQASAAT